MALDDETFRSTVLEDLEILSLRAQGISVSPVKKVVVAASEDV